jgi:hypothetical protein
MTDPSGHEPILDPDTGQQAQTCGNGTEACDLSDFTTYLQGVPVDAHQYPGYEVTYFPALQIAFLAPAAQPVTNTPYQEPVYNGDPLLEKWETAPQKDPWVYPSQQPELAAKIVHDREEAEMYITLGTAFIGGALGPLSGAGAATTVGPATTVDECVAGCFNRAILRFNNGEGLTPAQLARVARDPALLPRMVGTRFHQLLFEEAQAAARAGNSIRATPPFTFGPDIYDTASGRWWDAMTPRPGYFEVHAVKYNPGFGTGEALYYGRFNCFVTPVAPPTP